MSVTFKTGDIFESECETLVNAVNTVGVMGAGLAKQFKLKYPQMFKEYKSLCDSHQFYIGDGFYYQENEKKSVLNIPTKKHWKDPSKLEYIEQGLDWFVSHYKLLGISSVAFPALGCGLGGLYWKEVGPLMFEKLDPLPIKVEIYLPYCLQK